MLRKNGRVNGYAPESGQNNYDFLIFHPSFYRFLG